MRSQVIAVIVGAVAMLSVVVAQQRRPMSLRGATSAHVLGMWVAPNGQAFVLGGKNYEGGKWIDVTYGRPLKRERDVFGSGPSYGKDALVGAPIWRAGADVTTRLKTEVPLVISGKTIAPGEYTLFIDLHENSWTFVVSSWPAQEAYDPNNKTAVFGAYGYTPDKDVLRTPMKLERLPHAFEDLSWEFIDMTNNSGTLALIWDRTLASVQFTVAG